MSWTRLTSISVTNGSAIVTVNSGSTINIKVGDALLIGGFDLVEIEGVFANQLQLGSNWNHATQSNVAAAIVPTFGDFNHAVEEIRKLRQATTDNLDAMEQWCTKPEGSVVFQSYDGKQFEARSVQQMEKDVAEIEERAESMMTDINAWGFARTEADMIADRERNNQLFAASGHIHSGKTFATGYTPINEGMFVRTNPVVEYENQFFIGCPNSTAVGSSETNHPVFNLSGITVALRGINQTKSWVENIFKLPPAPKGIEVYDSATGVLTNFETEIDPKYGDVAADVNEAVARAFEGLVKNGDNRSGVDGSWSTASGTTVNVTDGIANLITTGNLRYAQNVESVAGSLSGKRCILEYRVKANVASACGISMSPSPASTSNQQAVVDLNNNIGEWQQGKIEITPIDDGTVRKYLMVYGTVDSNIDVDYLYLRQKTTEVVTSPVDLVGVELFLRPINEADPFAYPYGMPQSKLTSVDGIPTVENTVRPITHFEMYTGDTTSRGRGWNLLDGSLSDAQKAKVFQKKHNIYRMNDGTLAQWTPSARTIRGLGNGDWSDFNTMTSIDALRWSRTEGTRVGVRGNADATPPMQGNTNKTFRSFIASSNPNPYIGVFTANSNFTEAVNGECYFYVVATVPRLNQFGYHPSINSYGTGTFSDGLTWDKTADSVLTLRDCVINATNGDIASGISGHPDGLYHDAIYDSGLNGLIDQRLKYGAWDASSSEQASVVREELNKGTYRGREKLVYTRVAESANTSDAVSQYHVIGYVSGALSEHVGATLTRLSYVDADGTLRWTTTKFTHATIYESSGLLYVRITDALQRYQTGYYIVELLTNLTVEGEFASQTVYAPPSDVLAINDLKYGWLGLWGGIPADSKMPLGRPLTNSVAMNYSKSTDKGDSWTSGTGVVKNDANETNIALEAGAVYVFPYKALANPTILSTNIAVHHAESGLPKFVDVFSSADVNYGAHLGYSLFNFTLKGSDPDTARQRLALNEVSLDYQGVLSSGDNGLQCQKHAPVGVLDSSNDTPACKVMMHQTSKSGMASLNIVANELRFDAVSASWSDDSKMKVKNGIFTDLANASCLAVIHELSNPYGFIKNRN